MDDHGRIIFLGEEGIAAQLIDAVGTRFQFQHIRSASDFARVKRNGSLVVVSDSLWAEAAAALGPAAEQAIILSSSGNELPLEAPAPHIIKTADRTWASIVDELSFAIRAHSIENERNILREVMAGSSDSILIAGPGDVIASANKAVFQTFGYTQDELVGQPISLVFPSGGATEEMLSALRSDSVWAGEVAALRKDGSLCPVHVSVSSLHSHGGPKGMAAIHARDVADQQRLLERLRQLSITDDLTGAFNSRYLWARLRYEFLRARRYSQPLSFLMVDLDHFKLINDTHGHRIGDDVLKQVTERLSAAIRQTDIIARYGGEEFSVILPNTDAAGALPCAEHIRALCEKTPFETHGLKLTVTVSIGVAGLEADVPNEEEFLRRSDAALLHAKRQGRNRVCSWKHGMEIPAASAT